MQRALVNSGVITNLFATQAVLDNSVTPEIAAQAVNVPDTARVGWRLQGDAWVEPEDTPIMPPTPPRKRVIDRQTLFATIPANVEFGIRQYAAAQVPDSDPTYLPRGMVGVLLQRVDTAENINLDLPANVAGFGLLVTLGLMTQAQADAVLAGPLV